MTQVVLLLLLMAAAATARTTARSTTASGYISVAHNSSHGSTNCSCITGSKLTTIAVTDITTIQRGSSKGISDTTITGIVIGLISFAAACISVIVFTRIFYSRCKDCCHEMRLRQARRRHMEEVYRQLAATHAEYYQTDCEYWNSRRKKIRTDYTQDKEYLLAPMMPGNPLFPQTPVLWTPPEYVDSTDISPPPSYRSGAGTVNERTLSSPAASVVVTSHSQQPPTAEPVVAMTTETVGRQQQQQRGAAGRAWRQSRRATASVVTPAAAAAVEAATPIQASVLSIDYAIFGSSASEGGGGFQSNLTTMAEVNEPPPSSPSTTTSPQSGRQRRRRNDDVTAAIESHDYVADDEDVYDSRVDISDQTSLTNSSWSIANTHL